MSVKMAMNKVVFQNIVISHGIQVIEVAGLRQDYILVYLFLRMGMER